MDESPSNICYFSAYHFLLKDHIILILQGFDNAVPLKRFDDTTNTIRALIIDVFVQANNMHEEIRTKKVQKMNMFVLLEFDKFYLLHV